MWESGGEGRKMGRGARSGIERLVVMAGRNRGGR